MLHSFFSALSSLTILRIRSDISNASPAGTLACFPIVGLLFGIGAMALVTVLQAKLPYLSAYTVVAFWLLLSGGTHIQGLAKSVNALLCEGDLAERRELMEVDELFLPGLLGALLLLIGKLFALLQAQLLAPGVVGVMVLLVPVLSRYVALMVAIGGDGSEQGPRISGSARVVIGTTLLVLLLGALSPTVALSLLTAALVSAMLLRWISLSRLASVSPSMLGATIETTELVMLWIPVLCAGLGINLALLQLW
ncbi:MAG: adenosylcobinamide-GDP ribazoletransferase [Bdellovibrionales bacterium]|nr:adenosylcobinamide-GDP ribazoletransferase [Bdellovibrionales bacterium]